MISGYFALGEDPSLSHQQKLKAGEGTTGLYIHQVETRKASIPQTPLSSLYGALQNSEYEEHGLGIPKRKAEGP